MEQVIGRTGLVVLVLGLLATATSAQDGSGTSPVAPKLRFGLEGAAGIQAGFRGSMQSIAFGFAPTRSLTLLVSAERSYVANKRERFDDVLTLERGGTEWFVSGELRYAFFSSKRVSPYVVAGAGHGVSRPNVDELFPPERKEHGIQVLYYGGGVRIPARPRLDVFVDARFIMAVEASSDYFSVHFPVRAGVAWRF